MAQVSRVRVSAWMPVASASWAERGAFGCGLGQPELERDRLERPPVDQACGHQQALLSREDPARGVLVAPSDGEHGCPVGEAKLIRQPSLIGSDGQLDGAGDRLVHYGRGDLGGVGRVDPGTE
jgi:hypothetical protein